MISFRNRRATLLPSTLTFALSVPGRIGLRTIARGLALRRQGLNAAAPQAPRPAEIGGPAKARRALPARQPSAARLHATSRLASDQPPQQPQQQQPQLQDRAAATRDSSSSRPRSSTSRRRNRLHSHRSRPRNMLHRTAALSSDGSQGTVRQQLAEYYASQGKTMPGTQPTWNSRRDAAAARCRLGRRSGSPIRRRRDRHQPAHRRESVRRSGTIRTRDNAQSSSWSPATPAGRFSAATRTAPRSRN